MAKILVVEDQPVFQNIYQSILEREGWEVTSAFNGADGLKAAKELKPDIILLDFMMQGSDGMTFLREFQAPTHPETKVIMLTNVSTQEFIDAAIKLGAYKYLVKAVYFTPKSIIGIIKEALAAPPTPPAPTPAPTQQ
jgi:two-component system, NtrC family, response regulator HydG